MYVRVGLLVAIASLMLLWWSCSSELRAQGPAAYEWSDPIDLAADRQGRGLFPTIVSDAAGGVHVFWDEIVEVQGGQWGWVDYAYWNGSQWSGPINVFIGSEDWRSAWGAQAVVDQDGIMHTVWVDDPELKYAQRHVSSPVSARSWINRVTLPVQRGLRIGPAAIALDDTGVLHVVYLHASANQPGVYYMRSINGGKDWELPVLLSDPARIDWLQSQLRYVVDVLPVSDTVHVVWHQEGFGLVYSQGKARGQEWSDPAVIPQAGKWPKLVALDDGRLSLFTTGTLNRSICLKLQNLSLDRGRTWSPAVQVGLPAKGCLGLVNVIGDHSGRYHIVVSGRIDFYDEYVEQIWYGDGDGERWNPLELVTWPSTDYEVLGTQPDFPSAAISEGRLLHTVFHTDAGKIWYSRRALPASSAPLLTFPPPAAEVAGEFDSLIADTSPSTSQPTPTQAATQPSQQVLGLKGQPPRTGNPLFPLIVSGVASAILVGIVQAWKFIGRWLR